MIVGTLRITIKDHKPVKDNGRYPTRLLVSSKNFTQCISKLAYKAIQKMFDKNGVRYGERTINNSFDLKSQLELLDLREDEVTAVSIDIKDMYPMCKFGAVKDAVNHYARVLSDPQRSTIKKCLEILKFSMGHTIVQFQGEYYDDMVPMKIRIDGV